MAEVGAAPTKLFVPGRICLLGEHSDWAGGYRRIDSHIEKGYALVTATDQGIYAEVSSHPDSLVLTSVTDKGEKLPTKIIPMRAECLLEEASKGGFWSYIAGVAYQVLTHYVNVGGLYVNNYKTDLPICKGLSSSAAICVLAARAFNIVYDLKLSTRGEMELAYVGEITTPSRCGRMDQACAFGKIPVLMTFDGDRLETREIRVSEPLHFVLVNLNARKDTVRILADLNKCFPLADNEVQRGVQQLLGPINKSLLAQSVFAIEGQGGAEKLGKLMKEAQKEFDRYAIPACAKELTAPVLHNLLVNPSIQKFVYGGKGVGSQGDGMAQFLAKSKIDQERLIDILTNEMNFSCLPLTINPTPSVRKVVIPAAGFGTRLFPATLGIRKEMFPVFDARDQRMKPAILVIVEEALSNPEIEEVVIVVQEDGINGLKDFFNPQMPPEKLKKFKPDDQEYLKRIIEMGKKVKFALQKTQDGFGHAVYCAKQLIGDKEPFMLLLGDHIYRAPSASRPRSRSLTIGNSSSEITPIVSPLITASSGAKTHINFPSVTRQLIDAFGRHATGKSMIAMARTPESEISLFGIMTGQWIEEANETDNADRANIHRMLNITEFYEKPTVDYARENLCAPGLEKGEYYAVFGLYILQPQIFHILEENIRENRRERGEFQLTSALERLRQEQGLIGIELDGERFDIGVPHAYLDTLNRFSQQ